MLHIIEHTILDTIKLVPFLFLTYLAMEYLEHRAGHKTAHLVRRAGKWGPLIGGAAGAVPQCGFSAAASNLYAGRVISLGTLLAIYLSTSDEMLPILISERAPVSLMVQVVAAKAVIGITAGFIIDAVLGERGLQGKRIHEQKHNHQEDGHDRDGQDHSYEGHSDGELRQSQAENEHSHTEHMPSHEGHHHGYEEHNHIHELCQHEHCNCEKDGVFLAAVKHTLQITFFVLLITFVLNMILHFVGEDALASLILDRPVLGPVLAGIVGLVPNCAASVVITQLYLQGMINMGSMMAGLLVGAGVGLVVLFRVNRHRSENLKIVGILYAIGVAVGIVIELIL